MAEVFQVNADLVGTARMEGEFDERGEVEPFEDPIIGLGGPAGAIGDGHAFPMRGVAGDGGVNHAFIGRHTAAGNGAIDLVDFAGTELDRQRRVGEIVLGSDDATAGIAVKAMDNARARDTADAAELTMAVMKQRVDECPVGVTSGRVDDQSGRFVEHEEISVFEEDLERDGLCRGGGRFGCRPTDGDLVARVGGMGCFDGAIIDEDVSISDESLNSASGNGGQLLAQVGVDPLAWGGRLNRQVGDILDFASHCQNARPTPRMTRLRSWAGVAQPPR